MGNERAKVTGKRKQPYWLLYVSILLSGLLLLSDAFGYTALQKTTARLGIALVFSAVALVVGNGRGAGFAAAIIIWVAALITFFL